MQILEKLYHGNIRPDVKFYDAQAEIDNITRYEKLTYGFKLGVLLTTEAFMGKDGIRKLS